jgi:hypothetical protein
LHFNNQIPCVKTASLVAGSGVPRQRQESLLKDVRVLRETLHRISGIRPDHTELACLKALVLFKPGNKATAYKL